MRGLLSELGASGLVAAVGAGGKKSLLQALAREAGPRSALTTTVAMQPPPLSLHGRRLIDTPEGLQERIPSVAGETLVIYAHPGVKTDRWAGVAPEVVAALHVAGDYALTLVKADGARMRGIKAPRADEPCVPPGTRLLLPVVSMAVLGRPLTAEHVHRPERLAALLGVAEGSVLSATHLIQWLLADDGALAGAANAEVVPVINQVDTPALAEAARVIARAALRQTRRFDRVLLSRFDGAQPHWEWQQARAGLRGGLC